MGARAVHHLKKLLKRFRSRADHTAVGQAHSVKRYGSIIRYANDENGGADLAKKAHT